MHKVLQLICNPNINSQQWTWCKNQSKNMKEIVISFVRNRGWWEKSSRILVKAKNENMKERNNDKMMKGIKEKKKKEWKTECKNEAGGS